MKYDPKRKSYYPEQPFVSLEHDGILELDKPIKLLIINDGNHNLDAVVFKCKKISYSKESTKYLFEDLPFLIIVVPYTIVEKG